MFNKAQRMKPQNIDMCSILYFVLTPYSANFDEGNFDGLASFPHKT